MMESQARAFWVTCGCFVRISQAPCGYDQGMEKLNQWLEKKGGNWPAADIHVMLFACFSRKDNGHYRRQHISINKAGSTEGNIDKEKAVKQSISLIKNEGKR